VGFSKNPSPSRKIMSRKYEDIQRIIIERQGVSRRLNEAIHKVRGLERHALRLEKRSYGDATRIVLLAYAMLRGKAYEDIERTCTRAPSASAIADVVRQHVALEDATEEVKRWLRSSSS
jgi:hypothetical protein